MPRGYSTSGDVIRVSADGVDLARIWDELQGTLEVWNAERDSLAALVTAPVTVPAEAVPQGTTLGDFEESSEFGVPVSIRTQPALSTLGFTLRWWDTAARFTWRFLLDAPASQVQAVHSGVLEADNRLTFTKLMGALFNNSRRANENGTPVMPLWAGAADDTPPPVLGAAFPAGHQHYLTSGSLVIDGTDVADLIRHVSHHGYGVAPGSRLIVFANPAQADVIRGFRKADGAPFDYVPGSATPAYLTDVAIVGEQAPASFEGQAIAGSYGPALIAENPLIPAGYVLAVATGGPNSPLNPLAFREHPRTELHGLRLVAGPDGTYPLQDSVYARGFGTGVRHRGAAAVMQVTAAPAYTPPAAFL